MSFLSGRNLAKSYFITKSLWHKEEIRAVHDVSIDLELKNGPGPDSRGNNVGLVGESGSGKSTLARLLSRLERPSNGSLCFRGKEIGYQPESLLLPFRREVQVIFQDAAASLNPRHSVGKILSEPLRNFFPHLKRKERQERIAEILRQVGLSPDHCTRFPHEFSGGQKRRLAIARAAIIHPALLVCDEVTSGLDVSLQGQLLNLFLELGDKFGVHYLLVSHDLPAVRYLCRRILVMYAGRIVEDFPAAATGTAVHPYTRALLESEPCLDGSFSPRFLPGEPPDPSAHPPGCPFHPRCSEKKSLCSEVQPELKEVGEKHRAACHLV